MSKILVVDDEKTICDTVTDVLTTFGFEALSSTDGREGYRLAEQEQPDLIVLDWMMKDYNGLQFTEDFRASGYKTPIIFLTARGDMTDFQVEAFRIGADDYLSKPFEPGVLVARIKAQLRRTQMIQQAINKVSDEGNRHVYGDGELIIDFDAMQAFKYKESCELTNREFQLLKYLETNSGRVCKRSELLNKVWEYDYLGDERTVDVTVRRTREKIEPDQTKFKYILTRRGTGYLFPKDLM